MTMKMLILAAGSGSRLQTETGGLPKQLLTLGGRTILEYWIPADDLPALNASIVGNIEVIAEYH